jgi:hypothetical protein
MTALLHLWYRVRRLPYIHGELCSLLICSSIFLWAVTLQDRRQSRMLAALPAAGLTEVVAGMAARYSLQPGEPGWQETPEPTGYNDTLRVAYQRVIPGPDGRPALQASLWFTLPHAYEAARAIVDLSVDFDAIRSGMFAGTPASIPSDLKVGISEVAAFLSAAWQTAMVLPRAGTEELLDVIPTDPPRLEFYIQNRRPENSGGERTLRTLDMVDFSAFGPTRKSQIIDMAIGVTAPLGLNMAETNALARQAIARMAEDFAFIGAETADI